jgi:hypothetical protein
VATGHADLGFDVDIGPLFQTPRKPPSRRSKTTSLRRDVVARRRTYAQNHPPGGTQFLWHGAVAPHVPGEFSRPKSHMRFWRASVAWTAMPKATVNKNRDLFCAENEIRLAWQKCSTPPAMDMG